MEELNTIRERSAIPKEDTWAIEDLYPSDEAWREMLDTLEQDKKNLISYAGKLGQSGQNLFDYLSAYIQR